MDHALDSLAPGSKSGFRVPALARLGEASLVRLGIAAVGAHLLDDAFLQPEAGASAGDHLLSGGVPVALLVLAAVAYPRLRSAFRASLALGLGLLALGAGLAVPVAHSIGDGPSGDDYTGLVATLGGLLLVLVGAATLWRTRRTDERRRRRYARRAVVGVAAAVVAVVLVAPVVFAYWTTHLPRSRVNPVDLGARYEAVSFTTSDGLELAGWYVPSRNRAAVIAFPGRSGPKEHARMLVRHGYGVLLFDPRGKGESEGDPHALGWDGEKDLLAAVEFLRRRPDVDPDRIGGLGLSVGGELLLEAAAQTDALKAVVSEGAGIRSYREQREASGPATWPLSLGSPVFTAAEVVFSNRTPPPYLGDLVARIAPRPVFLIYAGHGQGGEELNPTYYAAAGEPRTLWEIPEADHTGGLSARPEEYERRVIAFFDRALTSVR
jgi:uncharacterized protein